MENKSINEREDRLKKLNNLKDLNINPYPAKSNRDINVKELVNNFDKLNSEQKQHTIAGRIRSLRSHGNITFINLEDESGTVQVVISKKELNNIDNYKIFSKNIDNGDFIQFTGLAFVTLKGENSLLCKDFKILSKALRPIPDSWYGLKDQEERYRKRYLDILLNPEVRDMIKKKAKFWQSMRQFMLAKGFLEVETPVLETMPGGADAEGFITHHNALDIDVYLRISTGELWQKKLMVAGFEKTFEIGRQFRNEGMDAEHLQDYTQIEFYLAYADYEKGMEIVEEMYKYVAKETFNTLKFKIRNFDIDLAKKWERYDYRETVKEKTGIDILNTNEKEIKAKLNELKVKYDEKGFNITRAIDNLWKYCRKQIAGPGFLVGVPTTVSPLAKQDDNHPKIAQRFQPIIAGSELGNGYSELNNPVEQEQRFKEQQKLREAGDKEAQMHDKDFVEALEYGMPPTCGFGTSERLFSFLMNKSARETQIFPLLKPKK